MCIVLRIIFMISLMLSFSVSAQDTPINFEAALKYALVHNPSVKKSDQAILVAKGVQEQTVGSRLPHLAVELNEGYSNNPLQVFGYKLAQGNATFNDFGAAQFTGPASLSIKPQALNHPGFYNNLNKALVLSVPLFTGGRLQAMQQQSSARILQAEEGAQMSRSSLALSLYQSYEGVLVSRDLMAVAKQNMKAAQHTLAMTRALRGQSRSIDADVLLAENYVNAASLALNEATHQWQSKLTEFHQMLGDVNSAYVPKSSQKLKLKSEKENQVISQVMARNRGLMMLSHQLKSLFEAVKMAKSSYYPQVNLQLREDWNGQNFNENLSSTQLGVGLHWTLLSMGEQSGQVNQAVARYKMASYALQDKKNALRKNARDLLHQLQLSRRTLINSKEMAHKSGVIIDKIKKRYGRGEVLTGDMLTVLLKDTQAKAQVIQAGYQEKMTVAMLLEMQNALINH